MLKRVAVLVAILGAAPVAVVAAEAGSQPLDELDEVVVSGARLVDQVIALENSFYQLYNEVNKQDQFDIYCTRIPVREGSVELTRACLPQYYAEAFADSVEWHYRCQQTMPGGFQAPGCYTPPDPTFVLFARYPELSKHMVKVINSDPRLREMNRERAGLEIQLRAAYASHDRMKKEKAAAPVAK